jgi:hypothetical protein
MTAEPGPAEPRPTVPRARPASEASAFSPVDPGGRVEPGATRWPAAFTAEITAAVRFERRIALKTLAVLAALAVLFVLRALYLS